VVIHLLNK